MIELQHPELQIAGFILAAIYPSLSVSLKLVDISFEKNNSSIKRSWYGSSFVPSFV